MGIANGVVYRRAPTGWSTGPPATRKRVRTVWWRYELCEDYSLDFAEEYVMSLHENPDHQPSAESRYIITANSLTAFRGFQWDEATGPAFQPKSSIRATLVHDVMCAAIAKGVLHKPSRTNADLIFREILKADGMSKPRAHLWYAMVDTFG